MKEESKTRPWAALAVAVMFVLASLVSAAPARAAEERTVIPMAVSYTHLIEAMAAGLPVIATDMGGNSDIVNDEAGCGMLVEYDNPDSMAVAMKCFLEDPAFAARCRENARRTIEDKFEIHKMARATYGVYEKALHD